MKERGNSLFKRLDRYAGIPLSAFFALLRKGNRKIPPALSDPPRFGILCFGAIGDLLLLTALVNGLRGRFCHARIDVICSSANAGVLPILANVDDAVSFPVTRPDKLVKFLRGKQYDILFDSTQWARLGNIVCNLSGAKMTAGFRTRGQYRSLGYDVKVLHKSDQHEVDNFIDLGRSIWPDFSGTPGLKAGKPPVFAEKRIYCHMWARYGKGRNFKEWQRDKWRALIDMLLTKGFKVYLTGSSGERLATEQFINDFFDRHSDVVNMAGLLDLPQLYNIFCADVAVVSVNTGIMHLAALAGAKVVALELATRPERWGPIGKNTISVLPRNGQAVSLDLGFERPEKEIEPDLPVEDVLGALSSLGVN